MIYTLIYASPSLKRARNTGENIAEPISGISNIHPQNMGGIAGIVAETTYPANLGFSGFNWNAGLVPKIRGFNIWCGRG